MKIHCLWGALGAVVFFLCPSRAEIINDNSTTYEDAFNDSRLESGDEVNVAGTARLVTSFSFEYFAEFTATGDETARVRFYEMNGAPGENDFATPGTLFYDSGSFNISSGYRTVNITEMSALLPGTKFTWSVEFSGITQAESAGLLYYNPPAVGSSDAYFWEKENGVWTAVSTDGTGNNFAARVIASDAPTSNLRISNLQRQNNVATVAVSGAISGRAYALEYRNIVNAGSWQRISAQVNATGDTLSLTDSNASVPFRFYRVVQVN
jgi:hypothetical protein